MPHAEHPDERPPDDAPAISIQELARYFGPPVTIDRGAPREAWRLLLRVAGVPVTEPAEGRRTVNVPGQVLDHITLTIARGTVVCLVGPSGSGKTVLLRILAGELAPTSGRVVLRGTVASLLSVGHNVEDRLSALDNVASYFKTIGGHPDDAAKYADDVIAFAELQGFEDIAARRYSTGMMLRLSVALVVCSPADIILMDDVLSVGDIAFQRKCLDRLHAMAREGRTMLVVPPDDASIPLLGGRVVRLVSGRVVEESALQTRRDQQATAGRARVEWQVSTALPADDMVGLAQVDARLVENDGDGVLRLSMSFEARTGGLRCRPLVVVVRERLAVFRSVYPEYLTVAGPGHFDLTVDVPVELLSDGEYAVTVGMLTERDGLAHSLKASDAVIFRLWRSSPADDAAPPAIAMPVIWDVEQVPV